MPSKLKLKKAREVRHQGSVVSNNAVQFLKKLLMKLLTCAKMFVYLADIFVKTRKNSIRISGSFTIVLFLIKLA